MTEGPGSLESRLHKVFDRSVGRHSGGCSMLATATPEWDSLSHIKLVMELEAEFDIVVPPDDIPLLFTESSVVLDYVRAAAERS